VGVLSGQLYKRPAFPSIKSRWLFRSDRSNQLKTETLINIWGINFIWFDGNQEVSWNLNSWLRKQRAMCPVSLTNISFMEGLENNPACVYPACGHVHGYLPELFKPKRSMCPLCRKEGSLVLLKYPQPSLLELFPPTHCFNPCGCVASENTCFKWSTVRLHEHNKSVMACCCPYCLEILDTEIPYSLLRLQYSGSLVARWESDPE